MQTNSQKFRGDKFLLDLSPLEKKYSTPVPRYVTYNVFVIANLASFVDYKKTNIKLPPLFCSKVMTIMLKQEQTNRQIKTNMTLCPQGSLSVYKNIGIISPSVK